MYIAPGMKSGKPLPRLNWCTSPTTPTTVLQFSSPVVLMCLPIGFSLGQKCLAVAAEIRRTPAGFCPSAGVKSRPASSGIPIMCRYPGVIAPDHKSGRIINRPRMPFDVYCQARLRALEGEHIHESRLRDLRDLARSGEQTIVQPDACWPLPAKRLIRADADGQNPCSLET